MRRHPAGADPRRVEGLPRSVETYADSNRICAQLGGGGHPAAAGATALGGEETVRKLVYNAIFQELRG